MAKIYQTQDDLKRDQLQDESNRLKLKSANQDYWSLSLLGGGLVASLFNQLKMRPSKGLGYLSWGLTGAGVIEWVRSWRTHAQASALETQSNVTGTGEVLLPPPNSNIVVQVQEKDCGCHHKPKSFLEYAAKSQDPSKSL